MPLETGTYIYDLNPANPPGTDGVSQGDDHLRLIKFVLQNTFTNVTGPEVPVSGGVVGAWTVQYSYAPASYSDGQSILFIASQPNIGPITISVNGGLPIPVYYSNAPLTGMEFQPDSLYSLVYYNGVFNIVYSSDQSGGVTSFNGRKGDIILANSDITGAGGAVLNSPAFTGTPTAPTPPQTSNDGTLATSLFVNGLIQSSRATSVLSFNGRYQDVTLTLADIIGAGGAPIASPNFTGSATVFTPVVGDSSTLIANTAFVATALGLYLPLTGGTITGALNVQGSSNFYNPVQITSASGNSSILTLTKMSNSLASVIYGVRNANIGRWALYLASPDPEVSGNVGSNFRLDRYTDTGGLIDSPLTIARQTGIAAFLYSPTAPSPPPGDNSNSLATTAFVDAAVSGGGSFLPITGGTLTGLLTISAGGLNITGGTVSFSQIPTHPTPTAGNSSTQSATTAFVATNFAPIASATLTGTPSAPTPAQSDNSTHIATTAYINTALSNLRWNGTFA